MNSYRKRRKTKRYNTEEVDRYKENEKTQIQSQIYVYKNNLIT